MKTFQCLNCRNEIDISGVGPITLRCQKCDCRDLKVLETVELAMIGAGNVLDKVTVLRKGENFSAKTKFNDIWQIISLHVKPMRELESLGDKKPESIVIPKESDKDSSGADMEGPPKGKGDKSKSKKQE